MSEDNKHTAKWYLLEFAKTLGIFAVGYAPEILGLFPEHTIAAKAAIPLGIFLQLFRSRTKYQKNNLPSGVTKHFDAVPDSITGVRAVEVKKQK